MCTDKFPKAASSIEFFKNGGEWGWGEDKEFVSKMFARFARNVCSSWGY